MFRSPCNRAWTLPIGLGLALLLTGVPPAWAQVDTLEAEDSEPRIRIELNGKDGETGRIRIDTSDRDREVTRSVDHVRFGESVHIEKHEHILGDVVTLGGSIRVDGEVTGDCVAVMGKVELGPNASVGGEVVSVGGSVTLGDSAEVFGDVVSVGGPLNLSPTAIVHGELEEVSGLGISSPGFSFPGDHFGLDFFGHLIWVFVLIGLGVLSFHLFPSRMEYLADTVQNRGGVAFLAGFAGWVLWLFVFVILLVTIIGIPLALALPILTPVVTFLGYAAVARVVGSRMSGIFGSGVGGVTVSVLIGFLVLEGALLLAGLASAANIGVLGLILGFIGCSVIFIAATIGFGSFLITRFRSLPAGISTPTSVSSGPLSSGPIPTPGAPRPSGEPRPPLDPR